MKYNKKWFSLPLAMWLVLIISLLAYTILEYIIPFSRDIKWVENSSISYYLANSWIEEWLYHFSNRLDDKEELSKDFSWNISNEFKTFSSWSILPPVWNWNSNFDSDWNKISQWNPIQLLIWKGDITNWMNVWVSFKVPDLDWTSISEKINDIVFPSLEIINWQLSSPNATLNANTDSSSSNWIIRAERICDSDDICDLEIDLWNLEWKDLDKNIYNIEDFYLNNCVVNECSLKFSVVNKIETDDLVTLPFLEWKLDFWTNNMSLRYSRIESYWISYWYKKYLEIKSPSATVNEALDFTIFQ